MPSILPVGSFSLLFAPLPHQTFPGPCTACCIPSQCPASAEQCARGSGAVCAARPFCQNQFFRRRAASAPVSALNALTNDAYTEFGAVFRLSSFYGGRARLRRRQHTAAAPAPRSLRVHWLPSLFRCWLPSLVRCCAAHWHRLCLRPATLLFTAHASVPSPFRPRAIHISLPLLSQHCKPAFRASCLGNVHAQWHLHVHSVRH